MTTAGSLLEDIDQQERENELEKFEQEGKDKNPYVQAEKEHQQQGRRALLAAEKGRLFELIYYTSRWPLLVNFADSDGYTPLHRASYGGHIDCAKYLVKHGANIEAKTTDDWTPLHCAVRWNNIIVAEYLIKQGADVNAKSNGGNTPLHIVASNGRYSVTCDIIQLLLYHPNCDYSIKNSSGDTAYDISKRSGPFYKFWSGVMTLFPDNMEVDE